MQASHSLPQNIHLQITHSNHFGIKKSGSFAFNSERSRQIHDDYNKSCIEPELAICMAMDLKTLTRKCARATSGRIRMNRTTIRMWSLRMASRVMYVAGTFGFWIALKFYSASLYAARFSILACVPALYVPPNDCNEDFEQHVSPALYGAHRVFAFDH